MPYRKVDNPNTETMVSFKLKHFLVDVTGQRLTNVKGQHNPIMLPQQMMDVLVYLVQNNRTPITCAEIKQAIFKHKQVEIVEIERILSQLADSFGPGQQMVQKLGNSTYMLTADAEHEHGALPVQTRPVQFLHDPGLSRKKGLSLIMLCIVFIVSFSLANMGTLSEPRPQLNQKMTTARHNEPILAVLPFSNNLDDIAYEPIAYGISQLLANQLQSFKHLAVAATTSSFALERTYNNAVQIGALLDADYVIKGTLIKRTNQVVLQIQLLAIKTDNTLWQQEYLAARPELVSMQNTLLADIVQQLARQLSVARSSLTQLDMAPKVMEDYLHGLYYLAKNTQKDNLQAQKRLTAVHSAAPKLNQATLALTKSILQQYQLSEQPQKQLIELALTTLTQPGLDKNDPDYQFIQGQIALLQHQLPKAIQYFRQTLLLNNNHADALLSLGLSYAKMQLFDDADEILRHAAKLDPANQQVNLQLGSNQFYRGQWQSGAEFLTKAIDSSDTHSTVETALAYWHWHYGLFSKAQQWAKVALTKTPSPSQSLLLEALLNKHSTSTNAFEPFKKSQLEQLFMVYYYSNQPKRFNDFVLSITRQNPTLSYWQAMSLVKQKKYQAAIKQLTSLIQKVDQMQPGIALMLYNQLAYSAKQLGDDTAKQHYLKLAKTAQQRGHDQGLRSPHFISEMAAYFVLNDEEDKAKQLIKNTRQQGWHIEHFTRHNPIMTN